MAQQSLSTRGWQPAVTVRDAPGQQSTPGEPGPLQGEVRGFRERRETEVDFNPIVWTFRLERYRDGVRLPPIPVEMRASAFAGLINEGDTVQLYNEWQGGATARVTRVYNLTGGTEVRALDRSAVFVESLKSHFAPRSALGFLLIAMTLLVLLITVVACVLIVFALFQIRAVPFQA